MNILISTWSLQVGGGEILAMNLAAGLTQLGHRVAIFNQRAELVDESLIKRLLPPGVEVFSMADRPVRRFIAYKLDAVRQRLGLQPVYFERQQQAYLAQCLRQHQTEVVHSHATYADRMCLPVALAAQIPLIITEHGEYTQFTREGRRDFLDVLQGAQAIAAVSEYCRQTLVTNLAGLPPTETVYNGVLLPSAADGGVGMREHLGIPDDAFVLGMAARGRPDKGWQHALDAFRYLRTQVAGRPLRLVLIGGSEYLDELQQQCTAEPDIIFTGRVPNPDFFLAGLDVGLLPTYFAAEALPLVIIEYMMSGKPTIATRTGGIAELLQTAVGDTGQLIDLDPITGQPNYLELAAAMRLYCEDPALYAQHAANAQLVQRNFTMAACVARYEKIYARMVDAATATTAHKQ